MAIHLFKNVYSNGYIRNNINLFCMGPIIYKLNKIIRQKSLKYFYTD